MRKSDLGKPLSVISFACKGCSWDWSGEPARVVDDEQQAHHPYSYFSTCPICKEEREQAPWERSLIKAWGSATGPRTDEGKATSAKNLEGHPTREESRRTRFNAMKHGMAAKTATFFPAKPDGYSFCGNCKTERAWCVDQPACVKQTEIFLLHHAAFEQRDPKILGSIYANLQAALFAVLNQILQDIISQGVTIVTPQWYTTKDGKMLLATYVDAKTGKEQTLMKMEAHPLFRPFGELLSRTGLSLADMGMTARGVEAEENAQGHLESDTTEREVGDDFKQRVMGVIEGIKDQVARAHASTERDPVLIEYHQDAGS
jgi:hypothetical protein